MIVSGLKKDYTGNADSFAGIGNGSTAKTLTLTADMLGTTNVTVDNNDYTLTLHDAVVQQAEDKDFWTVSSNTSTSTATLNHGKTAYYELDEDKNTVKYHGPQDTKAQVVVSGLKSGLKAFTDTTGEIVFGETLRVEGRDVDTSYVTVEEGDGGVRYVTLKEGALPTNPKNGTKITLTVPKTATSKYEFALADTVTKAETRDPKWTVSGTTATLTSDVTAGYTVAANGASVTYADAKTGKTAIVLATITGVDATKNAIDIEKALTLNTDFENNKIVLPNEVLGTSNVTLKNGTQKFTIEVGDDVNTSKDVEVIGWAKSGKNAVYQSYNDGYYTTNAAKTGITYTKQTSAKTWLTLTGLKEDFKVVDDNDADATIGKIAGVEIVDTEVIISKDALLSKDTSTNKYDAPVNNAKVTLKGTNDTTDKNKVIPYSTYTISLDEESGTNAVVKKAEFDSATAAYTPSGTKATYTQTLKAGYILSADGRTLTYTDQKTNQTLFTVSGLDINFTATDDEIADMVIISNVAKDDDFPTKEDNGLKVDYDSTDELYTNCMGEYYTAAEAKAAVIRIKQLKAIASGIEIVDDEVTLYKDILGTSNVTLTQAPTARQQLTNSVLILKLIKRNLKPMLGNTSGP